MVLTVGLRLGNSAAHAAVGTQYILYIHVSPQFGKSLEGAVYQAIKSICAKIAQFDVFCRRKEYTRKQTEDMFNQTKTIQQWIKNLS